MHEGMYEAYIHQVAAGHFARRREKLAAIGTREQAEERQAEIRRICAEIFAEFPKRGELKVNTVETQTRDGYELEILTYESVPGMVVTANLYLPLERTQRVPAVVCPIGHWVPGKAHEEYQRLGQLLARRGMAALIYDGPGQGERVQLFDVTLRRSWVGRTVTDEHTFVGNGLFLAGWHLAAFMMFDAMRGLDALCARPDIDPERLGCTGASGGGTLTRFLCCMEPRLRAAVCVADNVNPETVVGSDAEQNLFGSVARGVAPLDLLYTFAPKPLLLAYCTGDKGAEERSKENLEDVGAWYERFGARGNVDVLLADGPHGYLKEIRLRAAEHFAKAFGLGASKVPEPNAPLPKPEALYATETGQVVTSLNTLDLFEHLRSLTKDLPPAVPIPADAAQARAFQEAVRTKALPHLKFPEPKAKIEAAIENRSSDWGLAVEKGRLIVEDGVYLPYAFYTAPEGNEGRVARPTVLALHERGISAIAAQGPWMKQIAAAGCNVMSIDVRATGETRVQPHRDDGDPYDALLLGSEASWARKTLQVGLNLFGGRVFDALRTLEYLRTRHDVKDERLTVMGIGRGALWALYAAALDEKVQGAVLFRGLSNYKALVARRRTNHHFSLYMPGVLRDFDLPHVAACVAPRRLTLINAVNQRRQRMVLDEARRLYTLTREIYKRLDGAENFRVLTTDCSRETLSALMTAITMPTDHVGAAQETWPD